MKKTPSFHPNKILIMMATAILLMVIIMSIPTTKNFFIESALKFCGYKEVEFDFDYSKDISLTGYPDKNCSLSLRTVNSERTYRHNIISSTPSVAIYQNKKLYIADDIMEHTTKELMLDYVTTCMKENIIKKIERHQNKSTWK